MGTISSALSLTSRALDADQAALSVVANHEPLAAYHRLHGSSVGVLEKPASSEGGANRRLGGLFRAAGAICIP